jgi:HK97 family phage portal protein
VALSWWQRYVWTPRAVQLRETLTLEQLLADQGEATAAAETVTADRALRLSTVYGCTRLLSDSVATLPIHAYRKGERDPLANLPALLQRPSADFPEFHEWCWAIVQSLCLRGNAYGVVTGRAGAGLLPSQVDLVSPDAMAVTREPDGDGTVRTVYRLAGVEQDPFDIWHVRAYPQAGSPLGLSPIGAPREAIGLGLGAERYGARFFAGADLPIGFLETDQPVDQDTADRLRARWRQLGHGGWSGWDRRRDIAVLGNGAKFRPLAIAPEESQFIQTQKFSVRTIARFYGVPPEMVAGETAGHEAYTSPEMRGTDFLTFTLRPWLLRIERAVSGLLPSTQSAKFNAGAMVRATLLDRYTAHKLGIEAGWLLRSEVRELEDRPPIAGIDDREPPRPEGGVA